MRVLALIVFVGCGPPPTVASPAGPTAPVEARLTVRHIGSGAAQAPGEPFTAGDRVRLEAEAAVPVVVTVVESLGRNRGRVLAETRVAPGKATPITPAFTFVDDGRPTELAIVVRPPETPPPDFAAALLAATPSPAEGPWVRAGVGATRLVLTKKGAGTPRPTGDPCTDCGLVLRDQTGEAEAELILAPDAAGTRFTELVLELRTADGRTCAKAPLPGTWGPKDTVVAPVDVTNCLGPKPPQATLRLTRIGPDGARATLKGATRVQVSDW